MTDIEKRPTIKKALDVLEKNEEVEDEIVEEKETEKKPRKKSEYVLTPARAAALEKMKAARTEKAAKQNEIKNTKNELVETLLREKTEEVSQVNKEKKAKKITKQVIVFSSDTESSEDEHQLVIKRKSKKTKEIIHEIEAQVIPEIQPVPRLRRIR